MNQANDILQLLQCAADNVNPKLAAQIREHGAETPLFGKNGCLDSLGLVAFIVAVETAFEERGDELLTLADERAMSQRHSPFLTVQSLADYINAIRDKK